MFFCFSAFAYRQLILHHDSFRLEERGLGGRARFCVGLVRLERSSGSNTGLMIVTLGTHGGERKRREGKQSK
jgi:hypothetical protein